MPALPSTPWLVPTAHLLHQSRKFFLSRELFAPGRESAYVGLFLWSAHGTFDEVRGDEVSRPGGLPGGQAASAGAQDLVDARLAEVRAYRLEHIEVEPFAVKVDGVTFGWKVGHRPAGER